MITFYCGVSEKTWNHHSVQPGEYACISPVYGTSERTKRRSSVRVPPETKVIQDSGAFSDGPTQRLTYESAFYRQLNHAERYGYASQITHRASYDLLIDEKWQDGVRTKRRWTEADAWQAVETTISAAEYIVEHRNGLGLILSAQGVSPHQYLQCTERILPLLDNERDILGLGGWCITGKLPKQMMPVFTSTMQLAIPVAAKAGVKRVHIWGVLHAPALAILAVEADRCGIAVSTDSIGPSRRPAFGQWGYADWTEKRPRPDPAIRGEVRALHVQAVRDWLLNFRQSVYYQNLIR